MAIAIKFYHPGDERRINQADLNRGICSWNKGNHQRKYFAVQGSYLTSLNSGVKYGQIGFWGEWEAESAIKVTGNLKTNSNNAYPTFIHVPIIPEFTPKNTASGGVHQNTDPCVFGDNYFYTLCKQRKRSGRPSYLNNLQIGDVIIFGSQRVGVFVVDTVFVIGDQVRYNIGNMKTILSSKVPNWYFNLTLNHIPNNGDYNLYIGATYTKPIDGMFSFFPCVSGNLVDTGFLRPPALAPFHSKQTQGTKRLNNGNSNLTTSSIWNCVVQEVLNSGLSLGLMANLSKDSWGQKE